MEQPTQSRSQRVASVGIKGAGLAGLSVARELLHLNPTLSISFFDTRPRLPHPQRTFCFFGDAQLPVSDIPIHTWNAVAFKGKHFDRRIDVSSSPYALIRGDDFFDTTLNELEQAGVAFQWECQSVSVAGDSLHVDGQSIAFDHVIDAAFNPDLARASLWQSFAGIWVQTSQPVFDPDAAMLMDLRESSSTDPISFMYILPTSPNQALVEHTTFSTKAPDCKYHLQRCVEWLSNETAGDYQVQETERGLIPMGLLGTQTASDSAVGSNTGTVRPATGYAFQATLKQARQVAERVLSGTSIPKRRYPAWLEAGDRLFLRALTRSPLAGTTILGALLERAPAEALVRFMAGDATLPQALAVWMSVPKFTMLQSLTTRAERCR